MFFQHIYDNSLAQGSYLIGCQKTGEAMVIDAKRDIDTYLQVAKRNNLRITHITETHIHADFLCGSRELAAATGAKMYLSSEGGPDWQYEFPHENIKDGDVIKMGNLTFDVMHTPGHTPESVSFLLTDHAATDKPTMIFTGDFVFVGDVGRPDLLEEAAGVKGTKEEGAKQMYQSIQKFLKLPDYVQVWPAHGAGSACGKALGAVPSSTVGYEKIQNWAMQFGDDEAGFVKALLAGQPEPPKYFAMMKKFNHLPRPLKVALPKYTWLSQEEFLDAYHTGVKIIDARGKAETCNNWVQGTVCIPNIKNFNTWAGWLVNFNEQFVLIANEDQVEDLSRKLVRIGLDNCFGFITGVDLIGLESDLNIGKIDVIHYDEVQKKVGNRDVQILDVRGNAEFERGHIQGATNIHVGKLEDHLDEIDPNKEIIVHCESGVRASMAYTILKNHGFENVRDYLGSMKEWRAKQAKLVTA